VKVLVTGAAGMLGKHVAKEATRHFENVLAATHADLDIADFDAVSRYSSEYKPDAVINCAGVVPFRGQQVTKERIDYESRMVAANVLGPHNLARMNVPIVHMSSDCVFPGNDNLIHASTKRSLVNPADLYGRTKMIGEVRRDQFVSVRGSFIGWESGLLAWFKEQDGKEVDGWAASYWNGTTVSQMARVLCEIVEAERYNENCIHVSGSGFTTKYMILEALSKRIFDLNVKVKPVFNPQVYRVLSPDIVVPTGEDIIDELMKSYESE